MESEKAPVSAEEVYATLSNTLSLDTAARTAAEAQLRDWERDAAPGFIAALVKVITEVAAVPEVRADLGWHVLACGMMEGCHKDGGHSA